VRIGEHADREQAGRLRHGGRAVEVPGTLLGAAREVQREGLAANLRAQPQLQIALGRLEHVTGLAHAVAELRQARPRAPLAVVEHLVGALAQARAPEARRPLAETLGADA